MDESEIHFGGKINRIWYLTGWGRGGKRETLDGQLLGFWLTQQPVE